jgi:dihydroxyacetone kinase
VRRATERFNKHTSSPTYRLKPTRLDTRRDPSASTQPDASFLDATASYSALRDVFAISAMSSKKFLNVPDHAVAEMLDGVCLSTPYIARIADQNVLVYQPRDRDETVAVISGGGSGHEPAMAGYLGEGMLTAAVCGTVYASPSVEAVLSAIRATAGKAGAVLVVMNYTGDRLNFGLAAERAKLEGHKVEMVIVNDDCALASDKVGIAGRRGLAGTLFAHKVAGAAAAAGKSLQEVVEETKACVESVGTMGVALQACTLPGSTGVAREIAEGTMELGLGIHGEPGASTAEVTNADEIVGTLLTNIFAQNEKLSKLPEGSKVALMVNSLGATPLMELYIAARAAFAWLVGTRNITITHAYVGTFMSAIDMNGFSLTVCALDDATRVERLNAPCSCSAWPKTAQLTPATLLTVNAPETSAQESDITAQGPPKTAEGVMAMKVIQRIAKELIAIEGDLTKYDLAVGDGDCGTTIRKGAEALMKDVDTYPLDDVGLLARAIGNTIRKNMGGTSGVLYDIFFTAAADKLTKMAKGKPPSCELVLVGFSTGVHAMVQYGGASAGDRTMLDALVPAMTMASVTFMSKKSTMEVATEAAKAAANGAEDTKSMKANAGRSSYVNQDVLKETPDPGAIAAATWIQAIASVVSES